MEKLLAGARSFPLCKALCVCDAKAVWVFLVVKKWHPPTFWHFSIQLNMIMSKTKIYYVVAAIIILSFFAYQFIPSLVTTYSIDIAGFWYFVIVIPLSLVISELYSRLYLVNNSKTWTTRFLKKYIHILFLFVSFMLLLLYQHFTKT